MQTDARYGRHYLSLSTQIHSASFSYEEMGALHMRSDKGISSE